jgi:hypothetical protein
MFPNSTIPNGDTPTLAQRKAEIASHFPKAFKACKFLKRFVGGLFQAARVGAIVFGVGFCLCFASPNTGGSVLWYSFLEIACCFSAAAVLSFVRLVIIFFTFSHYTITQLLGFIVVMNLLVSLAVALPGELKSMPIAGAGIILAVAVAYICCFDPEDATSVFLRDINAGKMSLPDAKAELTLQPTSTVPQSHRD